MCFIALQAKVDPNVKRYPTDKFAGVFLSSSMPQQPKELPLVSKLRHSHGNTVLNNNNDNDNNNNNNNNYHHNNKFVQSCCISAIL